MPTRPVAASKLAIPRPVRAVVSRPELIARLDEPSWKVAAVSAPAGFGKSTLLATWALARPHPPVWFSCDAADDEPVRFWTGLASSFSSRWPGVGEDAVFRLERNGEGHAAAVSLANDLAQLDEPVVVVIDDLHLAGPSPSVLTTFLQALAPGSKVVISGRRVPPASLARLRVAGELLELRSDDLRFSAADCGALLEFNGVHSDADEVDRIQSLTEGWPAAIQLAAMSLLRCADRGRFLDAMASTDRALTDFLVNEVLEELPEHLVEFLAVTSVLDEFDASLCVEMTGRDDAGAILQHLTAAGMFVVPLDDGGEWFRYHHLFGAFMRARLRAHSAERFHELNRRASAVLEDRRLVVAAMQRAFEGDDPSQAAAIVRRTVAREMYAADVELTGVACRMWLHHHGERLIADDPVLVLEMVGSLYMTAATEEAARWLALVEAAHPDPPPIATAYLHCLWAEFHLVRGQVGQALEHAEIAMAVYGGRPPAEGLLPNIYPVYSRVHLDAGNVDVARTTLDAVLDRGTRSPAFDRVRLPGLRAWVAFLDGELNHAHRLATEALGQADQLDVSDYDPGRVFAGVTLAGVLTERTEEAEAECALAAAERCADLIARPPIRCMVALQRAATARLVGDAEAAEAHLAAARMLVPLASPLGAVRFDLEAARQAVQFQPWAASPIVETLGDGPDALVLRARLAIEHDDPTAASAALQALPAPVTPRQQLEHGMLSALAARDVDVANTHLERALAAAGPERFVRTIISTGPRLAKLLTGLPAGPHDDYVVTLLGASAALVPPARRGAPEQTVEPLTRREVDVLRYLSSRLTNQEIAGALYVSVNTLKTHIKNVYRKLGVSSRSEAVAAGRFKRLI